jgi:cysteinyl-tRNA synthetase
MDIFLFNTLSRKIEKFEPIKDIVGLYTCGPTVYDFAHIGNFRTYIVEDILKRVLILNGYKVKHVMNITDVGHLTDDQDQGEDKIEVSAKKHKKTAWEIAEFFTDAFIKDAKKLNILMPDLMPRATEHIPEMIELIKKLEKNGYTYITSDGVYFDTSKFKDYGKLANLLNMEILPGARVEIGNKKNPTDFALWKFSPKDKKRQMEWESPWGVGFPGWHIECSAMSMKYLGEQFDIHCGGIDHINVHHTNEIAQSEAATGKVPFVKYWIHVNFLNLKDKKMAKSEGNIILIKDIEDRGFNPLSFRLLVLQAHFQSFLEFSWESLEAANNALKRLKEIVNINYKNFDENKINQFWKEKILEKFNNNLDTPGALSLIWTMLKSDIKEEEKIGTLLYFDQILGLKLDEKIYLEIEDLPKEIKNLIEERERLRKEKKYKEADEIREKLKNMGYIVIDSIEGVKVKLKKD